LGTISKVGTPKNPQSWSVAELGVFYTSNRSNLVSYAAKLLHDKSKAEEVVQDALIKVILASPELNSQEHAIRYMYRTIGSVCRDLYRLEGRRPKLVALDDSMSQLEPLWAREEIQVGDFSIAEDAAVIRQAISLLSPAERAALIMWEVEGRSTKEIAKELGVKEKNVRHTLSRARASLRRILSSLVIDSENGLTAAEFLSGKYKRSLDIARNSSKKVLSIFIILAFLFGVNTFRESIFSNRPFEGQAQQSSNTYASSNNIPNFSQTQPSGNLKVPEAKENIAKISTPATKESSRFYFKGLDKRGIPAGFTVADSSGNLGTMYSRGRPSSETADDWNISQVSKTDFGAANIFLMQRLGQSPSSPLYSISLAYAQNGRWIPLVTQVTSVDSRRLASGNHLLSVVVKVESEAESNLEIPATASGRDLDRAPREVLTRLVLNPSKTEVLSQAVFVQEEGRF
jgi:RNA polymerase sigma factor (sigma-70 family)